MRQTGRLLGVLCLLLALLLPSAHAADGVSSRPVDGPQASAFSLLMAQLQKMQSSAQRLNYSASFVYQQAALIRSSRLMPVVAGKNALRGREEGSALCVFSTVLWAMTG